MPLIVDVKSNALDDGPGIRCVIFFKGCPLRCRWCHNPEMVRREAELSFEPARCVSCDSCLAVCPRHALARERPDFVDRAACDVCLDCAAICPSGALSAVGVARSVDDLVAHALEHRVFFETSGGGVTLGGGEPTLFLDFAGELAQRLRAAGVHVLLQTCGLFDWERFAASLLPHLDAVHFDLKLLDDAAHRQHCGASNQVILDNFGRLQTAAASRSLALLPRMPLVPGITDSEANVRALGRFLAERGVRRARLLDYNPLWPAKLERLGAANALAVRPELGRWQPVAVRRRLEAILIGMGIEIEGGGR